MLIGISIRIGIDTSIHICTGARIRINIGIAISISKPVFLLVLALV